MDKRKTVIPFEELSEIEIKCACGTGVFASVLPDSPVPAPNCPACGATLGTAVVALGRLREFYQSATAFVRNVKGCSIALRIAEESLQNPR